jgi:hypothetical protein
MISPPAAVDINQVQAPHEVGALRTFGGSARDVAPIAFNRNVPCSKWWISELPHTSGVHYHRNARGILGWLDKINLHQDQVLEVIGSFASEARYPRTGNMPASRTDGCIDVAHPSAFRQK